MKYPYRKLEIFPSSASKRKKIIFRPIVPVILSYRKQIVGYEALVDSGADYNVFDAVIAQILGIRLTAGSKRQVAGIGNHIIKGYEHSIILKVGRKQYRTKVIFSKEVPKYSFGVLGNQGFFDHFEVHFNYRQKYVDIS